MLGACELAAVEINCSIFYKVLTPMDQQVDLSPYDQNFTTKDRLAPPSLVTQLTTYQDYFIHANTEMFQVRYSYLLQPYAIGPVNVRNTLNPKKSGRQVYATSHEGLSTAFLIFNPYADPSGRQVAIMHLVYRQLTCMG